MQNWVVRRRNACYTSTTSVHVAANAMRLVTDVASSWKKRLQALERFPLAHDGERAKPAKSADHADGQCDDALKKRARTDATVQEVQPRQRTRMKYTGNDATCAAARSATCAGAHGTVALAGATLLRLLLLLCRQQSVRVAGAPRVCCCRLVRHQPLQALHVQLLEQRVHGVVLRQLLAAAELRDEAARQLHAVFQRRQRRAVRLQ